MLLGPRRARTLGAPVPRSIDAGKLHSGASAAGSAARAQSEGTQGSSFPADHRHFFPHSLSCSGSGSRSDSRPRSCSSLSPSPSSSSRAAPPIWATSTCLLHARHRPASRVQSYISLATVIVQPQSCIPRPKGQDLHFGTHRSRLSAPLSPQHRRGCVCMTIDSVHATGARDARISRHMQRVTGFQRCSR